MSLSEGYPSSIIHYLSKTTYLQWYVPIDNFTQSSEGCHIIRLSVGVICKTFIIGHFLHNNKKVWIYWVTLCKMSHIAGVTLKRWFKYFKVKYLYWFYESRKTNDVSIKHWDCLICLVSQKRSHVWLLEGERLRLCSSRLSITLAAFSALHIVSCAFLVVVLDFHQEQLLFLKFYTTQWDIPHHKGLFVLLCCFTFSNNGVTKQWHLCDTQWLIFSFQMTQNKPRNTRPQLVDYLQSKSWINNQTLTHCIITTDDIIKVSETIQVIHAGII